MRSPSTSVFSAMGSTCEVTVVGGFSEALLSLARRRIQSLENRWSRFLPNSELSLLNDSSVCPSYAGRPHRVSDDTYLLIDHGVAAWRWTNGRFDPSVLHVIVQAGYDRSFVSLGVAEPGRSVSLEGPLDPFGTRGLTAPGCGGIVLDQVARTVMLPPGVGLDPGGFGKGLAADLVVETLMEAGARGVCVNMGGDIRVTGEAPNGGWKIGIANPFIDDDLITKVLLEDHGLATSNRLIRRWNSDGVEYNHLFDPATGKSVNGLVSASIISGQAWWSEVLAKVAMVDSGARKRFLPLMGAHGLYVHHDGEVEASHDFASFDARVSA
jgi:FAD:protein FMN transferase